MPMTSPVSQVLPCKDGSPTGNYIFPKRLDGLGSLA